jgi:DNA-binding protein H-NS
MKKEKNKNIIEKAHEIVYERAQEKERQYGPFIEGMQRAADIFSGMTGKKATAEDMYKALIALKLSRQSYNHKEDNILDAIAYLASMNDYLNSKTK